MLRVSLIRLPRPIQNGLEKSARHLLNPAGGPRVDFAHPRGESALLSANSLSWRLFKNPVTLLIGGLSAVILELAEPAVRSGVWAHSGFRADPLRRLQRTGLAAMVTVYGARSVAVPMIARVVQLHSRVIGHTPAGVAYAASDERLLNWVQATATYGFAEAYHRYVRPLSRPELDGLYRESVPISRLYGALGAPASSTELEALFEATRGRLEASPIIFEFLEIMRTIKGFPRPLRWLQGTLVRAAVELIPDGLREQLGLTERFRLRPGERWLVTAAARAADRICLSGSPPAQSCLRLGLRVASLYEQPAARSAGL